MEREPLAGLLVRRLRESGQDPGAPVSVAELHRVLIPYHECRDRLGYATKAEYDLALLRLLRDGRVVRIEEGRLADAVKRELDSPEPGLAFLKNFAAAQLRVRPEAVPGSGEIRGEGPGGEASGGKPEGNGGRGRMAEDEGGGKDHWLEALDPGADPEAREVPGAGEATEVPDAPEAGKPGEAAAVPAAAGAGEPSGARESAEAGGIDGRCWQCGEAMPRRQGIRYCPFCGTDQSERRCLACGEDLELRWAYCPRCGDEVRPPSGGGDP